MPQLRLQLLTQYDRDIWALFLPALVALLLEPLQQLADTVIIGRLGVAELGAAGLGTVLFQFSLGFFASLVFATTPKVADAMAKKDTRKASRRTAQGMWVALACGVLLQWVVTLKAADIVTFMSSDITVASFAVLYLKGRAWGIPPALIMMTGIGSCRGMKDMTTPLLGSLAYLVALVVLDLGLIFGLSMGMEGAGYAAALSQWTGAVVMLWLLARNKAFDPRDLLQLPSLNDIKPYLRMALSLSINNMSALAPTLVATSLATSLGPANLGAHVILRQLMGFWLQGFIAFNVTAHSLVSTTLSHGREGEAARIMARISQLAVGTSLVLGLVLYAGRAVLPGLFTQDNVVLADISEVLPLILVLMPLDALGTVLEGGLLGCSDTNWIAARATLGCLLSLVALAAASATHQGLLWIWVAMRLLNLAALGMDLARYLTPSATQGLDSLLTLAQLRSFLPVNGKKKE